ncbi:MAG: hypothetical protein IJC90_01375 [Clostridia bacterium]|nr:hypothetical protein [Clostridia bacterium]
MLKEKGKIILIVILVIQLITPFTFLIYQKSVNKHLEEPDEYIKLNIDSISVGYENELFIEFDISEIHKTDNYYKYNYIIFEPSINNEYSKIKLSNKLPQSNSYIYNEYYYNLFNFEADEPYDIYEKHGHLNLYNKYNELNNIAYGIYEGPLTEAYALVGIYNNKYKIIEIYIDGYTINEYVTLYENGEINLLRYNYYEWNTEITNDDYFKIIPENKRNLYYLVLGE